MSLFFVVYGEPVPQGSAKGFVHTDKATGRQRALITSDNARMKSWRQEVAKAALATRNKNGGGMFLRPKAVLLEATFFFQPPKRVKSGASPKGTRPDLDKLLRTVGDSLTGIVFEDDAQVAQCRVAKCWGSPPRAEVTVSEIG